VIDPYSKACLLGKVLPQAQKPSEPSDEANGKLTLRIRRSITNEYTGATTDLIKEMALHGHDNTWFRENGHGTTYEITDLVGSKVFFAGQLCSGEEGGSSCAIVLPAGQYLWRVNGALDPHKDSIAWTFCDSQGGVQTELLFEINDDGNCIPGLLRYAFEETREEEAVVVDTDAGSASGNTLGHRVLLQGTFDLVGLNSAQLSDHERTMLEYFLTSQFNDVKSVDDQSEDAARITAWQQKVPDSFYRKGQVESAVVDRVTFEIHINLDHYKLGGQANSTTKELLAHFKRYIGLVMESGAFISRMHKVRDSRLHDVTQVKLVELIKLSETGGPADFDFEDFELEDFIIVGAVFAGLLAGLIFWGLRFRSRKDKVKSKD